MDTVPHTHRRRSVRLGAAAIGSLAIIALAGAPAFASAHHFSPVTNPTHRAVLLAELVGADPDEVTELDDMLAAGDSQGDQSPDESASASQDPSVDNAGSSESPGQDEANDGNGQGQDEAGDNSSPEPEQSDDAGSGDHTGGDTGGDSGSGGSSGGGTGGGSGD